MSTILVSKDILIVLFLKNNLAQKGKASAPSFLKQNIQDTFQNIFNESLRLQRYGWLVNKHALLSVIPFVCVTSS